MRDRLIELLGDYLYSEQIVDHLLKNGVIAPPCKVGDKVYKVICTNRGNCCGVADFTCEECPYQNREVVEGDVIAIKFVKGVRLKVRFDNFTDYYCEDEIYYAREEAEKALKGGEG